MTLRKKIGVYLLGALCFSSCMFADQTLDELLQKRKELAEEILQTRNKEFRVNRRTGPALSAAANPRFPETVAAVKLKELGAELQAINDQIEQLANS